MCMQGNFSFFGFSSTDIFQNSHFRKILSIGGTIGVSNSLAPDQANNKPFPTVCKGYQQMKKDTPSQETVKTKLKSMRGSRGGRGDSGSGPSKKSQKYRVS